MQTHTSTSQYILVLNNVTKKYPGVVALDSVSFKVKHGKILSIVGENGAGKSTLLKVISGVIPYSKRHGEIYFENKLVKHYNSKQSEKDGIAIVHQELSISPYLSLYENIYLGNYISKCGFTLWNQMLKNAKYYLNMVGLKKDPSEIAGNLSIAEQQLLEVAKVLSKNAKLIIFDEPTSSLNNDDSFALLDIMKRLRDEQGIACIFVSHKLNEVEYVADDIIIIRDGKYISHYDNSIEKIQESILIKDIVGREFGGKFPPKPKNIKVSNILLDIKDFQVDHHLIRNKRIVKNASFNVRASEIVGIAGLVGSGRSELALSIFGRQFGIKKSGTIKLKNKQENLKKPKEAIKKGLMYASEDRKNLGLIQTFSIHENIVLASSHIYSNKLGIIKKNSEIQNSRYLKSLLGIKTPTIDYKVENLSGGNQQKVVIAKALTTKFDILIIDEPTKGIDVGSKYEIYKIIFNLASQGKAIVIISSELEELIGITNRIFVMSQGIIKGELPTHKATAEKIMQIAIGKKSNFQTLGDING